MSSTSGVTFSHQNGVNASSGANSASGQDKIPTMYIERPKMPRAIWDALRNHIIKERQRKKQEQQQTEEVEKMKRETERRKKQEAMTIEETKAEILETEKKLLQLKEQKHELFCFLKKVLAQHQDDSASSILNEDSRHRTKDNTQQSIYMQTNARSTSAAQYMSKQNPHLIMAQQQNPVGVSLQSGQKRPRSPSPPGRSSAYYRPSSAKSSSKYVGSALTGYPSVSSQSLHAHSSGSGTSIPTGYYRPHEEGLKGFLPQSSARSSTVTSAYSSSSIAAAHQRALAAAAAPTPPSAHGSSSSSGVAFRGGSSISPYPRSTSASTTIVNTRVNQSNVQNHSPGRYYHQREP